MNFPRFSGQQSLTKSGEVQQKLIQLVKTHEKLKHVLHFELYYLPQLKDYYRKFDFTDETDDIELLRCKIFTNHK